MFIILPYKMSQGVFFACDQHVRVQVLPCCLQLVPRVPHFLLRMIGHICSLIPFISHCRPRRGISRLVFWPRLLLLLYKPRLKASFHILNFSYCIPGIKISIRKCLNSTDRSLVKCEDLNCISKEKVESVKDGSYQIFLIL